MKHRVREAIFNLVGPRVKGKHAIDLFAGTGALGLEALSRGAARATFIERHIPMSEVVRANVESLGAESRSELLTTSAFLWIKRDMESSQWRVAGGAADVELDAESDESNQTPWLVFISPPYDFFVERVDEMTGMVEQLVRHAPVGSVLVVEADQRFDFNRLPGGVQAERREPGWDVRGYSPAVVGLLEVLPDEPSLNGGTDLNTSGSERGT
jgi:16S rRNA (guanine966-N2)-methyltransferase